MSCASVITVIPCTLVNGSVSWSLLPVLTYSLFLQSGNFWATVRASVDAGMKYILVLYNTDKFHVNGTFVFVCVAALIRKNSSWQWRWERQVKKNIYDKQCSLCWHNVFLLKDSFKQFHHEPKQKRSSVLKKYFDLCLHSSQLLERSSRSQRTLLMFHSGSDKRNVGLQCKT